jgi:hypothetical protein
MSEREDEGARPQEHDMYLSTTYSSKIVCGICGAPVRNVPLMYESMEIDWRCGKCLRRDKPVLEDHM